VVIPKAVKNLLFIAHLVMRSEAADPSPKAVRDDRILGYLNCVIPNQALSGEESAFPYTLIKATDCAIHSDDEWAVADRKREYKAAACSRHQLDKEYRPPCHHHPIPPTLHVLLMHACSKSFQ
jgi:hypothetical protein